MKANEVGVLGIAADSWHPEEEPPWQQLTSSLSA